VCYMFLVGGNFVTCGDRPSQVCETNCMFVRAPPIRQLPNGGVAIRCPITKQLGPALCSIEAKLNEIAFPKNTISNCATKMSTSY